LDLPGILLSLVQSGWVVSAKVKVLHINKL
jgi:hypothetical protein